MHAANESRCFAGFLRIDELDLLSTLLESEKSDDKGKSILQAYEERHSELKVADYIKNIAN